MRIREVLITCRRTHDQLYYRALKHDKWKFLNCVKRILININSPNDFIKGVGVVWLILMALFIGQNGVRCYVTGGSVSGKYAIKFWNYFLRRSS